jgi:hypothetical protein
VTGLVILGGHPAADGHHRFRWFRVLGASFTALTTIVAKPGIYALQQTILQAHLNEPDRIAWEEMCVICQGTYGSAISAVEACLDIDVTILLQFLQ